MGGFPSQSPPFTDIPNQGFAMKFDPKLIEISMKFTNKNGSWSMIFSRSSWICLFWLDKVPRLLSQMVAGFNFSSDGIESVKKTNRNKSLRFPKVSYRSLRFPVVSQGSLSVKPKLEHGHIVRCIQLMYHTLVHHMCKNFTND